MYVDGNGFPTPLDEDVVIWRYMDTVKLIALLKRQSLWFARADLLGDPHEGALSPAALAYWDKTIPMNSPSIKAIREEAFKALVRDTYANCWHAAEHESMAMWRIYARESQGVAVRSSFARLRDGILGHEPTFIGLVEYSGASTSEDFEDKIDPLLIKRPAYAYEHEIRALIRLDTENERPPGLEIPVQISSVVEAIVVAPGTPSWAFESLRSIVRSYAPIGTSLLRSDLDVGPQY